MCCRQTSSVTSLRSSKRTAVVDSDDDDKDWGKAGAKRRRSSAKPQRVRVTLPLVSNIQ